MIWLNDYDLKILFISFFLYFIIVRKPVRTFTSEFTIFGGNRALSLVAAKKCIFHFSITCIYLYIQMRIWFLIHPFAKGPWYGLVHIQHSYCRIVNIKVKADQP